MVIVPGPWNESINLDRWRGMVGTSCLRHFGVDYRENPSGDCVELSYRDFRRRIERNEFYMAMHDPRHMEHICRSLIDEARCIEERQRAQFTPPLWQNTPPAKVAKTVSSKPSKPSYLTNKKLLLLGR